MEPIFKDFLFNRHILVSCPEKNTLFSEIHISQEEEAFHTVVTLAKKFSIRITKNPELAIKEMISDAERCLGDYIPEPFYRGFPETVRSITPDRLLYDQLHHYVRTYGMGLFYEAGHSIIEEQIYEKIGFNEYVSPRDFEILGEADANEKLKECLKELLSGNRPLNDSQMEIIIAGWKKYGTDILPYRIPCKDTVVTLLCESRDTIFCEYLALSDTIKVLNYIQYHVYQSENLKALNLKNKDRKFLTNVIDFFFIGPPLSSADSIDISVCHEKKKIWCGLLHHIHYRPKNGLANSFVKTIRGKKNLSAYSVFEKDMSDGLVVDAAKDLKKGKGESELIRHLNYILSRCKNDREIEEVLKCL